MRQGSFDEIADGRQVSVAPITGVSNPWRGCKWADTGWLDLTWLYHRLTIHVDWLTIQVDWLTRYMLKLTIPVYFTTSWLYPWLTVPIIIVTGVSMSWMGWKWANTTWQQPNHHIVKFCSKASSLPIMPRLVTYECETFELVTIGTADLSLAPRCWFSNCDDQPYSTIPLYPLPKDLASS